MPARRTPTGSSRRYGTEPRAMRARYNDRRRDHLGVVSAVTAMSRRVELLPARYAPLRTEVMLSLAELAACFTVSFPLRICASMLRRIFPFSTSTQCFACGTNQLCAAARSFTLFPSRLVAFGMLPFAWNAFSELVEVKSLIQSAASVTCLLVTGTARSEPPRKPGMAWFFVWLGMTNCAVSDLYLSPVQQLCQAGPTTEAAPPCANTVYGAGLASSEFGVAFDAAFQKLRNAVRPLTARGESIVPTHLPFDACVAICPP